MNDTVIREANGTLIVRDARVFHGDWRAFDVRLVDGLIRCGEVRSVRLDLSSATCQIRFAPGSDRLEHTAAVYSACVRAAIDTRPRGIERLWIRERPWTTLVATRSDRGRIMLEALEEAAGRLRIRVRSIAGARRQWDDLLDEIGQLNGVRAFRILRWPLGLEIDCDPSHVSRDEVLSAASQAWLAPSRDTAPAADGRSGWPSPRRSEFLVRGPRRLLYLALGCGCLVMTFVGLVVPGIPTVPFLLASSYYLARSSRTLHRRLLESRLFGQVLRDWETHRGLSRSSKWKLAGVTFVAVLLTLLFAPSSPIVVLIVAVIVSLTLIGLYRIPSIEPVPERQLAIGT